MVQNDCVKIDNGLSWSTYLKRSFLRYYSSAFADTACTYFMLNSVTALQLDMHIAIRHAYDVMKYYLNFNN